jgi:hypothetical protein
VNGGWLDNWAESLIVVDTGTLGEAAKNPTSLVPFKGVVRVEHVLEDPFASDEVGANRMRTRSQVLLVIKISYSSSMAQRQDGSVRAAQMEVGTGESSDEEVADSVSMSIGSWKPRFTHVVIG